MKHDMIYAKIIAMLLVIAMLGWGITALTAPEKEAVVPHEEAPAESLHIAASFYPVYITTLNLTQGVEGVTVDCVVTSQAGCLHDYQMTPQERTLLETADVLVMNGAGAEAALQSAVSTLVTTAVIDLSQGQTLLESGHVHTHGHDHDHANANEEGNSHVWMSPPRYRQQVQTLCKALCEKDPAHAAQYTANAERYLGEIDAVWARLQQAASRFDEVPTVVFHDSLAYLAHDLDCHVAAALNIGENQSADPDTLKTAADALAGAQEALFLYDSQYDEIQYTDLQATPQTAVVLSVDTCVTGEIRPDRWLEAMTTLCEDLEAAA